MSQTHRIWSPYYHFKAIQSDPERCLYLCLIGDMAVNDANSINVPTSVCLPRQYDALALMAAALVAGVLAGVPLFSSKAICAFACRQTASNDTADMPKRARWIALKREEADALKEGDLGRRASSGNVTYEERHTSRLSSQN